MIIKNWEQLPENLRKDEVHIYYERLRKKSFSLILKRLFDIIMSLILILILSPVLIIISIKIKREDGGSVFYRQVRVTQYGKEFKIFKFRTMVEGADKIGSLVTRDEDVRITRVGRNLRKYRLDELPQLFNILIGDMTFVGTRPEVPKYVEKYTDEMMATLLLPAGVTSEASIMFKDEDKFISKEIDADKVYVEEILPKKMEYNLNQLKNFSIANEILLLLKTVKAVSR